MSETYQKAKKDSNCSTYDNMYARLVLEKGQAEIWILSRMSERKTRDINQTIYWIGDYDASLVMSGEEARRLFLEIDE